MNTSYNGSGFIVAKEGNTYTVLTAAHVVSNETSKFEILAPDGKRYPVDSATIQRDEGVDLAVVRFTSTENYQVATLANYNPNNGDYVFLGGYPKLGQTDPKWNFGAGLMFDKELGILSTGSISLETDDSGLVSSSSTFAGGYEMVYTNISYGGMSGAPVLDTQGRVIGIHGSVEGEYVNDEAQQEFVEVQLGYSLGISTSTFLGIAPRLNVKNLLPVENTAPAQLSEQQQQSILEAILSIAVPQSQASASQWLTRGNQLWRLGQLDEAQKAFDKAIQLNDSALMYLAWYGKGLTLFEQKKGRSCRRIRTSY
ncbi:tetratricopeptide repeat protein [Candidatus Gracilibacteria bacterium]|nr:tetratricopeptide repeat protein [Candidatus Gracilibacteria bacterium]